MSLFSTSIDIDYLFQWLILLLSPIFICFLLPATIIILSICSVTFLRVYRFRKNAKKEASVCDDDDDFWEDARQTIATVWDAYGRIYYGYEVEGLHHIPETGPALIVYYHGALPVDYYYLMAKIILEKKRLINAVGDKFLFSIPGWRLMMDVFHVFPGTLNTCIEVLKKGNLLSIAPGGVREAQFGDNRYKLVWGNRMGFAKVAIAAQVPIVPVFSVNVRESFRAVSVGQSWFEWIYDKTRLPLAPIYGGFPVKLKTIVGQPIPYHPDRTPEELATLTSEAIEKLIRDNQRIPGSIWRAIFDRFKRKQI